MQRKKLNSRAQEVPRKWELREVKDADVIHISWSFTNPRDIPYGLEERRWDPIEYGTARLQEVLQKGGGLSQEQIMKQRPGIMDTGEHLREIKHCQGGVKLIAQLLSREWKVADAWWELRESEQSKVNKKGHKKFRVHLVFIRKGEEKKLKDITIKGIHRLRVATWICHPWDDTRINKTVTVNFTFMQKGTPPEMEVVLPTPS